MDDLIKLFTRGINAAIDAKSANDAEAEVAALLELDAVIAEVHPKAEAIKADIEANKTAALKKLHGRFNADETKPG